MEESKQVDEGFGFHFQINNIFAAYKSILLLIHLFYEHTLLLAFYKQK